MTPPTWAHPVPRSRRAWIGIAGGAVVLVAIVCLVAAPELIRRHLVAGIAARVTEPVSIDDVDVNLLTGRARVTGLRVGTGQDPLLQVPTLDIELRYWPLLRGQTVLGYLTLHEPELRLVRTGPAAFNVVEAWRPSEGAPGGAGATILALSIRRGVVTFVDRTEATAAERHIDLELGASRVSSATGLRISPTSFQAELTVGRGTIALEGSATPFARPRGVELRLTASHLAASLFAPYLPERPRVEAGEIIAAEARYVLAATEGRTTEHFVAGRLVLGPLRVLRPGGGDPIAGLDGLVVEDGRVDFLTNTASVREATLRAPHLTIERAPDGRLELDAWIASPRAASEAPAPPAQQRVGSLDRVTIMVERARVAGGRIRLVDRSTSPAATIPIEDVSLEMTGLGLGERPRPGALVGAARIAAGRLELSGTLTPQPASVELAARLDEVPFAPFAPYADEALGAARADAAAVDGVIRGHFGNGPTSISGRLAARDVAILSDGAASSSTRAPFARADRLRIERGRIVLGPATSVAIERVHVDGPTLRLLRQQDGRLDLPALSSTEGPVGTPEPPQSRSDLAWSIGRIEVSRGTVVFRDEAVSPVFMRVLDRLGLSLRDLGPGAGRARLTLDGRLGGSPLHLTGWLTSFADRPRLHLEGALDSYPLSQIDPYAEEHLGYRIRRGNLTADVEFTRRPAGFDAVAHLTMRQIQLGARQSDVFRERVGIPLTLALDLLEGLDGSIRLRIPVSGQLTNPRFSVVDAVWDALRNTIVKLAAAPLRAIGSVVTLGGRIGRVRINPVSFPPGSAELDEPAERRLTELAEWLYSRPRVELEIRGSASVAETAALTERRLRERAEESGSGDYMAGLSRLYRAEKGFGDVDSAEQMEQVLRRTVPVSRGDLAELARRRAAAVHEALMRLGVDGSRLYVVSEGEQAVTSTGSGRVRLQVLS